jgi:hypothetical protein
MIMSILPRRALLGPLVALATFAACTEPRAAVPAATTPAPTLEARLQLSDSLPSVGAELVVFVRASGGSAVRVGSFTSRVAYDATGLEYLGDTTLTAGATRVTNPTPGLVRSAGFDVNGFADGTLAAYRFRVVKPAAVATLRLTMDELHEIGKTP